MVLYDFVRLNTGLRAEMCWERGRFIAERVADKRQSVFFSLDDFYVELSYNTEGKAMAEVSPFNQGERYDRVVESIKLDRLF